MLFFTDINTMKLTQSIPMCYDPMTGTPYAQWNKEIRDANQWRKWHGNAAWLYNPWTGVVRNAYDVGSDPFGHLIIPEIKNE